MGVQRINGESILEMTEPAGWPDVDEDELRQRMTQLASLASEVLGILESWQSHHARIFSGGIWTGGAAEVGAGVALLGLRGRPLWSAYCL